MFNFIKEVLKDRSEGKMTSHGRLLQFIEKHNDPAILASVYLKDQLVSLCEAYEVHFKRSEPKKILAKRLIDAIRKNNSIPFTAPVDDRQFQVVETVADEHRGNVTIRLRLTGN